MDLIVGIDGNIRVARLTTADGELVRPLKRLYCLDFGCKKDLDDKKNNCKIIEPNGEKTMNGSAKAPCKSRGPKYATNCHEKPIVTRSGRVVKKVKRFNF